MEPAIVWLSGITYTVELIPPAFLRKQEVEISSQTLEIFKNKAAMTYAALKEAP